MNGFVLKWVALWTMVIDHIGVCLFPELIIFRIIGRLAFPLYTFLLVEGYRHTKSVKKYALRLTVFALVSEIPFDLMMYDTACSWEGCNCIVTLLLGLCAMWGCEQLQMRGMQYRYLAYGNFAAAALVAWFVKSDYSWVGIMLVFIYYAFGSSLITMGILSAMIYMLSSWIQLWGLLTLIPIRLYHGEPGPKSKGWTGLFYIMYPAHLLILFMIRRWCL